MTSNLTDTLEVVEEIFNLKEPLMVSNNIEKRDILEANPTTDSAAGMNGSNTINFEINNTQNYPTIFDSALRIRGKIARSDGTVLGNDDAVEHNFVAGFI